ncbi:MAG TPA: 23S rRNA (guanosine(2251)-2'-O)-methyltransferase RlmB [Propionibacteriaceae bacterium]|nr:23S rRNA (guanosine(2251)-2'-O)-methyltransferase RlmB [Propionibacteriaceae bacterium]
MPGNSQRKGAVRRKGRGNTAGSGGRVRRALEGKGPTPKAEDRPYHVSYREKRATTQRRRSRSSTPQTGRPGSGPEWVVGRNAVLEAMQAGIPIRTAYVAEGVERDDRLRDILKLAASRGTGLLEVTRAELDRLTGGAVHQGVALQLPAFEYAHPDDLLAAALDSDREPLIVAMDSITDPRNLGAIVRSAAAFSAHGVLIPGRRSAGITAAAWKTSAGAAARIPIARATNLNRSLRAYADAGMSLIGLDGRATMNISDVPGVSGPLVLVVGSEGAGLSRLVREACDHLASIPISTSVESLNAGVAAGIALYEISRQRVGGLD